MSTVCEPATIRPYNIGNKPARVLMGMPHYGPIDGRAARAFFCDQFRPGSDTQAVPVTLPNSLPTHGCNILWVRALESAMQGGATHFAMLHADVAPQAGWLDLLLDEMRRIQRRGDRCDILSAAVAIKDSRGVVSTALARRDDPWGMDRVLSLAELERLPQSFAVEDVAGATAEHLLLVNTGCVLINMSGGWWRPDADGRLPVYFETQNRIRLLGPGQAQIDFRPEDWHFSRCAHEAGARVMATRCVKILHWGEAPFANWGNWGEGQAS